MASNLRTFSAAAEKMLLRTFLFYLLVFCILSFQFFLTLSSAVNNPTDQSRGHQSARICADEKCAEPISMGRTTLGYRSGRENVISFPSNANVIIYAKTDGDLWEGEIGKKRGLFPKIYVQETSILRPNKDLMTVMVTNPTTVTPIAAETNIIVSTQTYDDIPSSETSSTSLTTVSVGEAIAAAPSVVTSSVPPDAVWFPELDAKASADSSSTFAPSVLSSIAEEMSLRDQQQQQRQQHTTADDRLNEIQTDSDDDSRYVLVEQTMIPVDNEVEDTFPVAALQASSSADIPVNTNVFRKPPSLGTPHFSSSSSANPVDVAAIIAPTPTTMPSADVSPMLLKLEAKSVPMSTISSSSLSSDETQPAQDRSENVPIKTPGLFDGVIEFIEKQVDQFLEKGSKLRQQSAAARQFYRGLRGESLSVNEVTRDVESVAASVVVSTIESSLQLNSDRISVGQEVMDEAREVEEKSIIETSAPPSIVAAENSADTLEGGIKVDREFLSVETIAEDSSEGDGKPEDSPPVETKSSLNRGDKTIVRTTQDGGSGSAAVVGSDEIDANSSTIDSPGAADSSMPVDVNVTTDVDANWQNSSVADSKLNEPEPTVVVEPTLLDESRPKTNMIEERQLPVEDQQQRHGQLQPSANLSRVVDESKAAESDGQIANDRQSIGGGLQDGGEDNRTELPRASDIRDDRPAELISGENLNKSPSPIDHQSGRNYDGERMERIDGPGEEDSAGIDEDHDRQRDEVEDGYEDEDDDADGDGENDDDVGDGDDDEENVGPMKALNDTNERSYMYFDDEKSPAATAPTDSRLPGIKVEAATDAAAVDSDRTTEKADVSSEIVVPVGSDSSPIYIPPKVVPDAKDIVPPEAVSQLENNTDTMYANNMGPPLDQAEVMIRDKAPAMAESMSTQSESLKLDTEEEEEEEGPSGTPLPVAEADWVRVDREPVRVEPEYFDLKVNLPESSSAPDEFDTLKTGDVDLSEPKHDAAVDKEASPMDEGPDSCDANTVDGGSCSKVLEENPLTVDVSENVDIGRADGAAFVPEMTPNEGIDFLLMAAEYLAIAKEFVQLILDWVPEPAHSFLRDLESTSVSPRVIAFTFLVGVFTLILQIAILAFNKYSKERGLSTKLCDLHQLFFTATTERDELREKLDSINQNMMSWQTDYIGTQQHLSAALAELEAYKGECGVLRASVANAEQQLEEATEAGLELNRMLSEFLASQNDGCRLQETVDRLQEQQDAHRVRTIELQQLYDATIVENQELRAEIETQVRKNEENLTELRDYVAKLSQAESFVDTLRTEVSSRDDQIEALKQTNGQLLDEAQVWNETVKELEGRVGSYDSKLRETAMSLELKSNEVENLKECVSSLRKITQDRGTDGELSADDVDEVWKSLLDVSSLKSELTTATKERDGFAAKIQAENDARKEAEALSFRAAEEAEILRREFAKASQDREEAIKKLEILSGYFKDKEMQLQKELGAQEAIRQQNQDDVASVHVKMNLFEQEVGYYKSQIASLKAEIENQERSFKNQIASQEKKAHENWLAARSAERRLEEHKQEAAIMRNKLTLQEKNNSQVSNQSEKRQPNYTSLASNGEVAADELPSPPRLVRSDRYDSTQDLPSTSSRTASLYGEPLIEFNRPPLPFLPIDRPLPPSFLRAMPPGPPLLPLGPPPPPFDVDRRGPPMMMPPPPPPPLLLFDMSRGPPPPPIPALPPPHEHWMRHNPLSPPPPPPPSSALSSIAHRQQASYPDNRRILPSAGPAQDRDVDPRRHSYLADRGGMQRPPPPPSNVRSMRRDTLGNSDGRIDPRTSSPNVRPNLPPDDSTTSV